MGEAEDPARIEAVSARVDALSSALKSVLATLVLRGVLNRAEVATLLQETEAALRAEGAPAAGITELAAIETDLPSYLRAAVGPAPDPDEDDH